MYSEMGWYTVKMMCPVYRKGLYIDGKTKSVCIEYDTEQLRPKGLCYESLE